MSGTRTIVAGLGASGLAAARYLAARGDDVLVLDSRTSPPGLDALRGDYPSMRVELGTLDARRVAGADRLVLSPGLSIDEPIAVEARKAGIEVLGELELFARVAPAPVIAVTGSNGKSTVVTLTAQLLQAAGITAHAGGNLGPPALDLLDLEIPDFYVLEVSSFQLETLQSLQPRVAAVLNVSADHLDRHGTIEAYAATKARIFETAAAAIYNADDPIVVRMAASHPNAIPFSVRRELDRGWSAVAAAAGGRSLARDRVPLVPAAAITTGGAVGEANALAALALADCAGAKPDTAAAVLRAFRGLPHRLQFVAEKRGVRFVDDSKGTNVGASCSAIESVGGAIVLIAGGLAKGGDFAPLARVAAARVRHVVLLGQAADAIEAALGGSVPVTRVDSIEAAVAAAALVATPGTTVLLSPACASQDMFRDYQERGRRFAAAVAELPG